MHLLCNVYTGMNIATLQNMDYFLQVKHSKSFLLKAWSVQFLNLQTTLLNSGESEPQPNIASQSKQGNSLSLIGRDRHVLHFIPVRWTQHTKVFFFGGGCFLFHFLIFMTSHSSRSYMVSVVPCLSPCLAYRFNFIRGVHCLKSVWLVFCSTCACRYPLGPLEHLSCRPWGTLV